MRQEHMRKSLAIFLILVLMTGSSYTSDFSIYAFQDDENSAEILSEDNYVLDDTAGDVTETDITIHNSEPDGGEDSLPDVVEDIANGDDAPDVSGNDAAPSNTMPDPDGLLESTLPQPDSGDAGLVSTQLSAEVSSMEVSAGGDMPEDADLLAYTIGYAGQYEQAVSDALGNGLSFHAFAVFDISIVSSGEYWQPSEDGTSVDISIDGLDLSELSSVSVFRIEGEEVTDMDAESTSETVSFETDHFTVYVVGEVSHDTDTLGVTASGTWLGLSYTIYDDGLCVVTGTQTAEASSSSSKANYYGKSPWYQNNAITSLYLDYKANRKSQFCMFRDASNVTGVSFGDNFDLSSVTHGYRMFSGCSSLINLTLPDGFGSQMTNGDGMFRDCSSLTDLALPDGFGSVMTDGSQMFNGCSSLTSIVLPDGFGSVMTDGLGMFSGCSSLTSLALPDGFGSQMTEGGSMFRGCSGLTSLTLPDGFGSQMTEGGFMFYGCSGLTGLTLPGGFGSQMTSGGSMFYGCRSLTSLALPDGFGPQMTNGSFMFYGCRSLTSLTLPEGFGSVMTNGHGMFFGCSKLQTLDIHSMDMTNVTEYTNFLSGCTALEELNPPALNPIADIALPKTMYSHPDNTAYTKMPVTTGESVDLCSTKDGVYTINGKEYALTDATTTTTWLGLNVYIFSDGMCIVTGTQTGVTTSLETYENYYGNSPWYNNSSVTKLYLDYNANGKSQEHFFQDASYATSILIGSNFDTLQVTSMPFMFSGCSSLTLLDLSNFDTTQVTKMPYMFSDCSALTSLDLSNFNTSQVTDMSSMFDGCSSLTSLDLSNFDTSQVTDMSWMFQDCSSLTSLNLSNFNTSQVTSISRMFKGCSSLASLDVSNFDTSKVTEIYSMFSGCSSLTLLDLSNFNTSQVTDMLSMFNGCSNLISLDLSNFNTSRVTGMYSMFLNCSSLTALDLSNFDTSQVTSMRYMFDGCSALTSLDLSNFDTSQVTNMQSMFQDCSSLTSLNLSNFNTSQVTSKTSMFSGCSKLEQLQTPAINSLTDISLPVTLYSHPDNTSYTKLPVTAGESIALYNWKDGVYNINGKEYVLTEAPTTTTWLGLNVYIFDDGMCIVTGTQTGEAKATESDVNYYGKAPWYQNSSVTSLYLDYNANGKSQLWMFRDASYVIDILTGNNFDTLQVTSMSFMFYGCSKLASLDLSNFDTSQVTSMHFMFDGCSALTSLDLSNFNTSQVTDMSYMFCGCSKLTLLELSSFNTAQVTDMSWMFKGCSSLASLDLSNFDTSRVNDMSWMFNNCSALTSLDLSNFNTSQVTDVSVMFNFCSNLEQLKTPATNSLTDISLPKTLYCSCKSYTNLPVTTGTSLTLCDTPADHTYGEYISNNDGHDCVDGTKTATCLVCGGTDTITDVGSAPGSHVYENSETNYTDKTKTNFTASWSGLTVTVQNTNTATNSSTATYEMNIHLVSPKTVSVNSTITGGESGGFLGIGAKKSTTTIYLDGSQVTSYSGNQSNKSQSISVPAGDHVLKIVYLTQSSKTSNSLYKGIITLPAKEDIDVCTFCGATTDHHYVHASTSHDNSTKEDILTHECEYCGKSYTERVSTAYTLKDGTIVDLGNNKGSGKWLGLDWFILQDGMCVLTGTQIAEAEHSSGDTNYYGNSPWYENSSVTSLYLDYKANGKSQQYMFRDASYVTSVSFGDSFDISGVTNASEMFSNCHSITSLALPEGFGSAITDESSMFSGCSSITSLTIPDGFGSAMTNGSYMFSGCSSLTSLIFPDGFGNSVTSSEYMFYNCSNLKTLDIHSMDLTNVTVYDNFLSGCTALEELRTPAVNTIADITLPVTLYSHPDNTSYINMPVTTGDSVAIYSTEYIAYTINEKEYVLTEAPTTTTWLGLNVYIFDDGMCIVKGTQTEAASYSSSDANYYGNSPWYKNSAVTSLYLDYKADGKNQQFMFCYASYVTGVSFGDTFDMSGVTDESFMFQDCSGLTRLTLPDGFGSAITDGWGMFQDCSGLTSLTLPDGFGSAMMNGSGMFYDCSGLTSLTLPDGFGSAMTDGSSMFYGCSSLTSLTLPDGFGSAMTDGSSMFYGCSSLTSLTLPDGFGSAMTDESSMFYGCSSLTSLTLPDGFGSAITKGGSMFNGCSGLTGLTLPGGFGSQMTEGGSMFRGCSGLTSLTLPDGFGSQMTEGGFMFYGCSGLTGLTLPGGFGSQMTEGSGMFAGCSGLISLDLMSTAELQVGGVLAPLDSAVFKTSSTSNISGGVDNGSGYGDNTNTEDTVTVEGAEKLYVELVCQTENTRYDYLTVCDSTGNDLFGKLGGNSKFTKAFTVTGDSVTFRFCSDSGVSDYYGYYAKVYDYADCSASEGFLSQIPKEADLSGMLGGCYALEELRLPRANSASFALPKFMYTHPDNQAYCAGVPRTTGESITLYGSRVMDSVEFSYTYNGVSYGREDIVDFWYIGNDSGTHGNLCLEEGDDNITLYLLKKGDDCILYAQGSGRMADYAPGGAGWCLCETVSLATDLVFDDGILNIGAFAFYADVLGNEAPYYNLTYGYMGLRRVFLPESISSIGMAAFYGCTMLECVDIPSGVTKLPDDAFTHCTNLLTVSGGENLTDVASGAFLVETFPGGLEAYLEGLREYYALCSQTELDRVLSYAETCYVDSVPVDTSLIGDSDYLVNTYDWASDNRRTGISYAFVFSAPSSISLHTANDDFATESSFMIYGLSDTLKRPHDSMIVDIQVTDALTNEGGRDLGMYFVDEDGSSCLAKHLSDDSTQLSYAYGAGIPDEYTETFEIRVHDTAPDSRDMFTGAITFVTSTYDTGTGGSGPG